MGAGASFFSTLKASICLVEELIQLMEEIWFPPQQERCHITTGELSHHGGTPGTREAHERCHNTTGELAHHGATPGTRGD